MCSFGDFVALSHFVDIDTARVLKGEVSDGIIAPGFDPEALEILKAKKKGTFIVLQADESFKPPHVEFREVSIPGIRLSTNKFLENIFVVDVWCHV